MTNHNKISVEAATPEAIPQAHNQAEPKFSRIGNSSFVSWVFGTAYSFFKMPATPTEKQNLSMRLDQYFSGPRRFR